MRRSPFLVLVAAFVAAPLVYAHSPAGTPDTTCEDTVAEIADHDHGPPITGWIFGFQESNLEDCNGDTTPGDDDGHAEYARGGAWLLVNSGDGVTGGSIACFGEAGHHPAFGPIEVVDLILGPTVYFEVGADTINLVGPDPVTGTDCGDFQSDNGTSCVGTCTVTFPPRPRWQLRGLRRRRPPRSRHLVISSTRRSGV